MRALGMTLGVMLAISWPSRAPAADLRFFTDASLRAVQFVDRQEGWAVGDEGTIWHTMDGGQNWEKQATGTRASLRGLHFLNPFVGWVVGREEQAHGSVGVLLFTRDGGLTWQRLLDNAMPGLNGVRFLGGKNGLIFGDPGEQFPSGVFKTADGGRTWEPVSGPPTTSWLAAAFYKDQSGIFAGAWSRLATFRQDVFKAGKVDTLGGRSVHGIYLGDRRAFAVGDGGLVLTSRSRGDSWGFAEFKLPVDALAGFDFHAVHGCADHVWVVGRPGSVILHSPDQGGTWKLQKTGQPLPLHGVFFLDELRGWAVGDMGTILGTVDGGNTWKIQHQGGKRAAILLVNARSRDVPADALSHLGLDEGYRTMVLRVTGPDPASANLEHARDGDRLAGAARRAGGVTGELLWQFPFPRHLADADKKTVLEYWNQLHDGAAGKHLLRQMVLALRIWRPDAVICDHPDSRVTGNPAGALAAEALHEALALAADPKAFPDHQELLLLAPWRASKMFAPWHNRTDASVTMDNIELRPALESSARDFAMPAAVLLGGTDIPGSRFFRVLESKQGSEDRPAQIMDGLALTPGGEARRQLPEVKATAELKKAYQARRNLEALAGNLADPQKTLAQIGPLLNAMPDDQGAAAAFALANLYARRGQWTLAREAFLLMVDHYPSHPLSADAYRWLIRHISSSEARRRHELEHFVGVSRIGFTKQSPAKIDPAKKGPGKLPGPEIIQTGRLVYLSDLQESRQWYRGSLEFARRLAGFGPLYASDPGIQFCLQSSRRNLGQFASARDMFVKFKNFLPRGSWHDAAAAELWLENRLGPPPKAVAGCFPVKARPFLDGKLDDACWQERKPMVLKNASGDTARDHPTEAWLAFDAEYFYIALRCRHPKGEGIAPVKPRPRDGDLRSHDRVSIILDLDRDYSTYFHLQVDQRGWPREDCWGDASWNPRWFVAVHNTDEAWHIEAAIPMSELTGDRVRPGAAWACNIVRILPGRGLQAFASPAGVEPRPEGLGLLLFLQDPPPKTSKNN